MVFEQLYSVDFLKNKPWFALFLGIGYAVLGITIALFTFPNDPALVAVGIISILFIPSLSQLTTKDEVASRKGTSNDIVALTRSTFTLVRPSILVYTFAFLGMFMVFAFFAMALPQLATNVIFKQQLDVLTGPSGHAVAFEPGLLRDLVINNFLVLILCFVISLVAGNGSILFITWNASVWGTIFGVLAKTAAHSIQGSPVIIFLLIMISVIPHMLLEMLSYVLASISGTLLSDGIVRERLSSAVFGNVLQRVIILFVMSLVVVLVAGIVETFVLNNFTTYATIIQLSFS